MKFKDMKYERPDAEAAGRAIDEMTDRLSKASSYEEAREVFLEYERFDGHLNTQVTIAHIRFSIDTRDEFYSGEEEYWNRVSPELNTHVDKWMKALLESPFRKQFEDEFGSVHFLNAEIDRKAFSEEIVEELQKEGDLKTEYNKLISSASIPFMDGVYTLSQLIPFKTDPDDELRLKAWQTEGEWFKTKQDDIERIYDELVKIRDTIGRKLGHENFVNTGYHRMTRNCYTAKDVAVFREAVVKYVVPLADKCYRIRAKELGLEYPVNHADSVLDYRDGNPKPKGGEDDILAAGRRFYEGLSPETGKFFNMMLDNDLMDVKSTEGKRPGGFMDQIIDHKVPFIFANFNGTQGDVDVVTHEAGHAFAGYMNADRIPLSTIMPSLEACEVHSMSMEFFAESAADDFFGDDAQKYLRSHLEGAITFIPYGAMVDHFQHIVYENPSLTPAQRNEEWKKLSAIYMPWIRMDESIPFYGEGRAWERQAHIFARPFYYIDYCLAQTVALQFWSLIREDADAAWEKYMAYTKQGGSETFTVLLENAGLKSPFDEEVLKGVCARAEEFLDEG